MTMRPPSKLGSIIMLMSVVGLAASCDAGAAVIAVNDPFLQLYNVGVNSDGFTSGQLLRFGATSVIPNGASGTTGSATTTNLATGALVTRSITFNPGPAIPNFFTRNITYSSALTGPWTIDFQSPGYTNYQTTLSLPSGATETPFVNSITLTGSASNPTFSWTPPPGTIVNGYRVNIYDKSLINNNASAGPINDGQVVSQNLQPNVTSFTVSNSAFTVPGYALTAGNPYSIEISILQTRDGQSTNLGNNNVYALSRVYADFTPLNNGNAPAVNLPVTLANGSFQYDITVQAGQTYYIDPTVATGYEYAIGAGDPEFASVMLPGVQTDPFEISFFDGTGFVTDQVLAGVVFDFPTGGVDAFSVTGIDPADGLDPNSSTAFVTALTFVGSGTFTGTQTARVTTTVPEPEPWTLFATGLCALIALNRSRYDRRATRDRPRAFERARSPRAAFAALCCLSAIPLASSAQSQPMPTLADFNEGDHWVWRHTDDLTHMVSTVDRTVHKVDGAVWLRSAQADRPLLESYTTGNAGSTDPAKPWRAWPLEVGKRWEYAATNRGTSITEDVVVAALEEVEVPAGKFMAYRIDATGQWQNAGVVSHQIFSGTVNETSWYAPAALTNVKVVYRAGNNQYTNELTSFTRGPQ